METQFLRAALEELMACGTGPEAAGAPGDAHLIETHISLVLIGGSRAYKFKKPLDLGFLDFRTLEDRQAACRDEVRLNRRLAEETYLGIARLVRAKGSGPLRLRGADEPDAPDDVVLDVAVEMRRLPEEMMLDKRLDRGDVTRDEIAELARRIARFHAACPSDESFRAHASPDALRAQFAANLTQLDELPPVDPALSGAVRTLRSRMEALLAEQVDLIERRIAGGRVREGHGDLHTRNICMPPGEVIIFDCVEFSLPFRCRDVAGEVAFLAMDLTHRGHPVLADVLLRTYAEAAEDPDIIALQPLHQAHYAIVRAKVEALRASEEKGDRSADRAEATGQARAFLLRAIGLTQPPTLILMCGLPGSGKSFLATELVRHLGFDIVRSDLLRKELAGLRPTDRSREPQDTAQLYGEAMTHRVYGEMLRRAEQALAAGRSIILDATMPARSLREPFIHVARRRGAPLLLIEATCGEQESRRRLGVRAQTGTDPSDADWKVYLDARARFEVPDEVPERQRCRVATDTASAADQVSHTAARLLGSCGGEVEVWR